ncbi:MAG: hypothetical protein QOC80_165 [Frankiaceae bacterium]|nr:hypothetical protein [Frankiaceae bacterium]
MSTESVPAWRRQTQGEQRWPAAVAVLVAAGLQLLLPDRLALGPKLLLPVLALITLVALVAADPGRMERHVPVLRRLSLLLVGLLSCANIASGAALVVDLLTGHGSDAPTTLLRNGAVIYVTNVLVFGLWYWELDRGGPVARAHGLRQQPDFLFPQMQATELVGPDWEPRFLDYLYLAFTNVTAFSPTDTLPLSRWAKMLMAVQSGLALLLVALVFARAVNVLR